ncbi:hypothetical protein RRG08_060562 [Elysia crispata]|uniref:Transmembrane inner ear expressed protein n=1 Tax=Elysia crispata TaxID=231223 RepID=A0AAE1E2K2_9GAST|nr:hypothetical protein RRG08_060562 [Elysia crispata]
MSTAVGGFQARIYSWICLLLWINGLGETLKCLAQEIVTEGDISTPLHTDRGIEEEIVGPFRIWHIIFLAILICITIIVVICWCHPVRIPRTRQEIEENYKKRVINRNYLRLLERNPDKVVKKTPARVSATESSRQPRPVRTAQIPSAKTNADPPAARKAKDPARLPKPSKTREVEEDDPDSDVKPYRPVAAAKAARLGAPTPLALNPRDLLALMAKRREDGGQ